MGSLKRARTTFYRSSIDIMAVNCLVFDNIAFLHFEVKIKNGGSRHLGLYGSSNRFLGKPMYDSYRSSVDTIALNCLVFF